MSNKNAFKNDSKKKQENLECSMYDLTMVYRISPKYKLYMIQLAIQLRKYDVYFLYFDKQHIA